MLPSLEIVNFRTFPHLVVERLGQVNLIVGRNNVGKTTLLEALQLYGSAWPAHTAARILHQRDEVAEGLGGKLSLNLAALFHGRIAEDATTASIGPVERSELCMHISARTVNADFGWEGSSSSSSASGDALSVTFQIADREFDLSPDRSIGYHVPSGGLRPPDADVGPPFLAGLGRLGSPTETARRWDRIVLTSGEQRVLDGLQRMAPVTGVRFVEDPRERSERLAIVRLDGVAEPIPLAELGDGIVRVFQIGTALEYASLVREAIPKKGVSKNVLPMLLMDEVEVGIHYSQHDDLWRSVFHVARQLGVQVFATTHSWDCVMGFQQAAAESEAEGVLIRLEAGRGKFKAFTFSEEDLAVVTRERIEVR